MPLVEVDGTSGTLQLGGPGVAVILHSISVGTGATSGVVTVKKGNSSGATIATMIATAAISQQFNTTVLGGVYIAVTGGAALVTVSYD